MKKLIILRTMEGRSKVHQYKDHEVWSTARVLDYPEIDVDLVFEIHKKQNNHKELLRFYDNLRQYKGKKILHEYIKGVTNYILYPYDYIIEKYGRYFCSSYALMLVYAIELGYKDIKFLGIRYNYLDNYREIFQERTNLEYWIGYFRGQGINIDVSDTMLLESAIMYGKESTDPIREYFIKMRDEIELSLYELAWNKKEYVKKYLAELDRINRIIAYI